MNRIQSNLVSLLLILLALTVSGCASKKIADVGEIGYVKDAFEVKISATPDLNSFNDQAHTVVLVFYQLSEPSIFKQMLEAPGGVTTLLEAKPFDASVISRRQVVIQPGESREISLDRPQNVRYLAMVAGFYAQEGDNYHHLLPVSMPRFCRFWCGGKIIPRPLLAIDLVLGNDGFTVNTGKLNQ